MRNQAILVIVAVCGLAIVAVAASPLGAAPQASGGIAVIDNFRVFEESNPGRSVTEQIQANVNSWQAQIAAIETEVQALLSQRQTQAAIMTADALRALDANIEQRQIDLQRFRDDASRQAQSSQDQILAGFEATLTPVVGQLAAELGYRAVLNTETPGLLYFDPAADITDQLIARLNSVQ